MIRLDGVGRTFARADGSPVHAVRDLTLEIRAGESLALLGPSGCGKTTTLRLINRLIDPTTGQILVGGQDISQTDPIRLRRRMGYVVQSGGLFPHMTVARNIGLLCELEGWAPTRIEARVDELLALVKLAPGEFRRQYPRQLSGGQRQRVGVARALALDPEILLMDEPFGALDPITRDTLQDEFKRLQTQLGLTAVLVTHDMTEALLLADRIAVMQGGRMLRIGTPRELMQDPGDAYVATLLATPKRHADRLEALTDDAPATAAGSLPG